MSETPKEAARRLFGNKITAGYDPVALHTYVNADGQAIYYRARMEHRDGDPAHEGRKFIRPFHLNGNGYKLGEPSFPANRTPIYNQDRIAADAEAYVWIVEGEKAADALTKKGAVATTSGGADSARRADWSPLAGRACILWPDNDDAGRAYMGEVSAILEPLGCKLSAINIESLGLPAKGDAFDWLADRAEASLNDLLALPRVNARPAANDATEVDLSVPGWPDAMAPEAMHGIAGEFVRMIEPNTEADPAAILMQFLAAFGALVGRGPHVRIEGDQHHCNLFELLVGATARGRKGTSMGRVRDVFEQIAGWKPHVSGLSSGEGLKYNVRDQKEETKRNSRNGEMVLEITDQGVTDKRLFVVESEFASALRAAQRPGNTLSATIREGWDSGNLRTLTKNDPVTATGAHICIVGHITADELRAELTATDSANGFANRFLFVAVKRSKLLPFAGDADDPAEKRAFADRLRDLAEQARTRHQVTMTEVARATWTTVYPQLSAGGDGLHGAVTARAEAQVIRLALVYALLDGADQIDQPHLLAALAIWQYCDQTAKHIFGASLGDRNADEIMRRLGAAGDAGLTRTEIRDIFGRNLGAERIGAALELLQRRGRATCERTDTGGRPGELWKAAK